MLEQPTIEKLYAMRLAAMAVAAYFAHRDHVVRYRDRSFRSS